MATLPVLNTTEAGSSQGPAFVVPAYIEDMTSSQADTLTDARRESARKANGKFGAQDHSTPEVNLGPSVRQPLPLPLLTRLPPSEYEIRLQEEKARELAEADEAARRPLGRAKAAIWSVLRRNV